MSRVKDIDILIRKYEERLQGLQEMAKIEEDAHYGTGLTRTPENEGYELSLCLDALREYRRHLVEDTEAIEAKRAKLRALCYSSRANDILGQLSCENGLGSPSSVQGLKSES